MLDAHFTDIVKMLDFVCLGKFTTGFRLLRRFNIFIRHKMIQDDRHTLFIKNVIKACFFELINRYRRRNIIS